MPAMCMFMLIGNTQTRSRPEISDAERGDIGSGIAITGEVFRFRQTLFNLLVVPRRPLARRRRLDRISHRVPRHRSPKIRRSFRCFGRSLPTLKRSRLT